MGFADFIKVTPGDQAFRANPSNAMTPEQSAAKAQWNLNDKYDKAEESMQELDIQEEMPASNTALLVLLSKKQELSKDPEKNKAEIEKIEKQMEEIKKKIDERIENSSIKFS